MSTRSNKDIQYGDVDLTSEDLDMNNAEIRITGMIPVPVYTALKTEARKRGVDYWILVNELLTIYTELTRRTSGQNDTDF